MRLQPIARTRRSTIAGRGSDKGVFARTMVGLAARGNTIRPMPKGLPLSHRSRGTRHLLAMSPDPKRIAFRPWAWKVRLA